MILTIIAQMETGGTEETLRMPSKEGDQCMNCLGGFRAWPTRTGRRHAGKEHYATSVFFLSIIALTLAVTGRIVLPNLL
jgi:hypothetical protein